MLQSSAELATQIAKQTEKTLLDQLNDFISRGLLVVEESPISMHRNPTNGLVELSRQVKLTLKDKEYILQLEKENKEMKELLQKLSEFKEVK